MILTALTPDVFMLRSRALSNGIATSTVGIPYSMSISSIGGGSWICQLPLFMLTQPRKALRDTVSLQARYEGSVPSMPPRDCFSLRSSEGRLAWRPRSLGWLQPVSHKTGKQGYALPTEPVPLRKSPCPNSTFPNRGSKHESSSCQSVP